MENLLEIGKIVNTHGLRGEVKVVPWTDSAEDFEYISSVYIKIKNEYKDPNINGIAKNKISVAPYIGWRTTPYSPVSMTF